MSVNKIVSDNVSALIFLPTEVNAFKDVFLHGQIESFDKIVNIYVTSVCHRFCQFCLGFYSTGDSKISIPWRMSYNWIHLRRTDQNLILEKLKVNGVNNNCNNIGIMVIYYNHKTFLEMESSMFMMKTSKGHIPTRDHFGILKLKLEQNRKKERASIKWDNKILSVLRCVFLFFSMLSTKALKITEYSSLGRHLNNYLTGLAWVTKPGYSDMSELIKKINVLCVVASDVLIGAISLNELNQYFPLESSPNFLSGEMVVQLLKGLINWLTGNPAGFKLNYIFSKLLATFFLFYIDMWCAFLAILRPAYKTIMTVFFFIGKAGITFQVSIIEDILTILTFHIYCICLFAARLYNIQINALLALWRLFVGRKKNPLRDRVDSCKYTPEQLFIGTLGFTILLFLLPTTLIYYTVFTFMDTKRDLHLLFVYGLILSHFAALASRNVYHAFGDRSTNENNARFVSGNLSIISVPRGTSPFRIILTSCKRALRQMRYLVQSLQLYSVILWLTTSPKVSSGIKLVQYKPFTSRNCLVFYVKPVCSSLEDTLAKDKPDFFVKAEDFNFIQSLYSLLIGRVQHC